MTVCHDVDDLCRTNARIDLLLKTSSRSDDTALQFLGCSAVAIAIT